MTDATPASASGGTTGPDPAAGAAADDRPRPSPRPAHRGAGHTSDPDPADTLDTAALDPASAFAELGRLVLDQPVGAFLQKVADLATHVLPNVEGLSVTLVEDGKARSAAFTSPVAALLDERQYETGFGPCLDAAATGATVRVDVAHDDTYPAFARAADRHGVTHTASVGMPMPQRVVGAMNLYSISGTIDDDTVQLARTFASYAAVALANAALYDSSTRLAQQLQIAMDSRAGIEQAKGILMARYHFGPDEAFEHLVRTSQQANIKLRVLAADLVDRARRGEDT